MSKIRLTFPASSAILVSNNPITLLDLVPNTITKLSLETQVIYQVLTTKPSITSIPLPNLWIPQPGETLPALVTLMGEPLITLSGENLYYV